jgi:uncharacterized protein YqgQ
MYVHALLSEYLRHIWGGVLKCYRIIEIKFSIYSSNFYDVLKQELLKRNGHVNRIKTLESLYSMCWVRICTLYINEFVKINYTRIFYKK